MSGFQAFLLFIVVLVIISSINSALKDSFVNEGLSVSDVRRFADRQTARAMAAVKRQFSVPQPEEGMQNANQEYFDSCQLPQEPDEECTSDLSYANSLYGGNGRSYKDWVKSQAIDSTVVSNHDEYIKDQMKNGNMVGRTWSPDSHDSVDPIPWVGIRGRPQAVPICNPTQVPDVDMSWYAKGDVLTWKTGRGGR